MCIRDRLSIDHVQGDPFAAPSKLSIHVSGQTAAFPRTLYRMPCQRIALQDELTRRFGRQAEQVSFQAKGSGDVYKRHSEKLSKKEL